MTSTPDLIGSLVGGNDTEQRIQLDQMWWMVEPAMMMLTWSCSSERSGRGRATGKWPVEVLFNGDCLALLEVENMSSSVAAWSGPARTKHRSCVHGLCSAPRG